MPAVPRVKVGDLFLSYEVSGRGEPLVLIMGFGLPGAAWKSALPFLSGFRCFVIDNRGTGASDRPGAPYTMGDMAEDVAGLMDVLELPRAFVYGVSMGGMIGQELALRYPEKVAKLVLGCTSPGGWQARMAEPSVIETVMSSAKSQAADPGGSLERLFSVLYPASLVAEHPELKQRMLELFTGLPPTPPETAGYQMAAVMGFSAWERLPSIKCPVLIVHGDADVLVPPENARLLKQRIPHAELFMIPGAGHDYQVADPIGIHRKIVAWLRQP